MAKQVTARSRMMHRRLDTVGQYHVARFRWKDEMMNSTATISQTRPVGQSGDLQQARRLRQVAEHCPSRLWLLQRVYQGQTSPRECIKAFCLECNGWEEAAIRDCTAKACPLYRLRPYQKAK
jgi:hypothetical protein